MKHKTLFVPVDCEGALQTAIRIRIVYLQSYREQIHAQQLKYAGSSDPHDVMLASSYERAKNSIITDIANLTMLTDNLAEAESVS